jgi:hypothetical protein
VTLPGGAQVRADGRLGLTRLRLQPKEGLVEIDYQPTPEQQQRIDMASALFLTGFNGRPGVTLNGTPLKRLSRVKLDGKTAYVVPLAGRVNTRKLPVRVATADATWAQVAASKAHRTFFQDWYVVGPFPNPDYAGQSFQLKEFGPEQGLDLAATYTGMQTGEKEPQEGAVRWRALLPEGAPTLAAPPVNLLNAFAPNRSVIGYAATTIVSDRERTVQLLTGGDERLAVWVNGERVVFNKGYRLAYRDQDRVFITLKQGENSVLLKVAHGYESWQLYFRLADEYGLPITGGIHYKGPHGLTPAGG